MMIIISGFLTNICSWCVNETSQEDVSFTHQKLMFFIDSD